MEPRLPAPLPASTDRRVCVADDDVVSLTMLQMILKRWEYEPVVCRDGQEAYERLMEPDSPSLALLDWMMPRMDGTRLCQLLRADTRRTRYLILLTARTEDTEIASALRSGADDYVSKPFSPHVLQARIEVGFRTLELHRRLAMYASEMQELAASRAAQLVHSDRMASIGLLSASVAHEINNPTSFLSVNIQTLRDSWPAIGRVLSGTASDPDRVRATAISAEMPAILGEMEDGVSRIRLITSELRSFSRTGGATTSAVDLANSLAKAMRMCSIRLKGKVEIRMELPPDLPKVVADETRLEQVFVNLIINAADVLEDRDERWISVSGASDGKGRVRIRVEDSGPGISPDLMPSLFQPFFTTKPSGKGTGLGLHISRQIVEEFGGGLTLVPPQGTGACFEVALPETEGIR
jgi:C4-dicarboxylate-specific signal transduction histidine kinase